MGRIISIGTAVPSYCTDQRDILDFMQKAYADETASRKLSILFNKSGINRRYSVIPDFGKTENGHVLFNENGSHPNVEKRLNVFKDQAAPLAIKAIQDAVKKINSTVDPIGFTHLITVTCTGLSAPGIDAEIIEQLKLPDDIFHVAVNFQGCNAAFHALKIGDVITRAEENAKVLIVCVELCTLHFQPKNNSDNLLSNTIFGDGAAAVIMVSESAAAEQQLKGFSLNGFCPVLLSRGKDLMGWNINPLNFEMILSAGIPEFLGEELEQLMAKVDRHLHLTLDAIQYWAIHPGGMKILDTVRNGLQFKNDELSFSYEVLRNYGNMSSPTILFVLSEIFNSNPTSEETVFAMGFGPGISIETASMVCHDFI